MTQNEAKCSCQHCSAHIVFPRELAGQTQPCPACGLETMLYVPPPAFKPAATTPAAPQPKPITKPAPAKTRAPNPLENGPLLIIFLVWLGLSLFGCLICFIDTEDTSVAITHACQWVAGITIFFISLILLLIPWWIYTKLCEAVGILKEIRDLRR